MNDAQGVFFNAQPKIGEDPASFTVTLIGADVTPIVAKSLTLDEFIALLDDQEFAEPKINQEPVQQLLLYHPKDGTWPVRDQGRVRGTCVAFAALATAELRELRSHEAQQNIEYAEEFVYAEARTSYLSEGPGDVPEAERTGAIFLLQAVLSLACSGNIGENRLLYRYVPDDPAWTAQVTEMVKQDAAQNKLDLHEFYFALDFPERSEREGQSPFPKGDVVKYIRMFLESEQAVSITLPVYSTGQSSPWTVGNAWKTGVIPDPTPQAKEAGAPNIGHAICIIGMIPDPAAPDDPTKGWFIFRNSWGTRFGYKRPRSPELDAVLAPGYGAISFGHVEEECWGIMSILKKT